MIEFIKNYWKWILLVVVLLIIIVVTKKRKYFIKDIDGNKIGFKEFCKRFKKGVDGITPIQKSKSEITGVSITMVGLISGIITMSIVRPKGMWWWVVISLSGGLILTIMNQVSNLQKYWKIKKVNEEINKINEEQELKEYKTCIICGNECSNGLCDCLDEEIKVPTTQEYIEIGKEIIKNLEEMKGGENE